MRLKFWSFLSLFLGLGILVSAFAAERVVVCEELYQEDWPSCPAASCTLATIEINNPGRVAVIEMHIDTLFPLCFPEVRLRRSTYPPPYRQGQNWYYVTPWLWFDGNKDGGYRYADWDSIITDRMTVSAPVTITMWGDWSPGTGVGTIYTQFRNDSTDALTGYALLVVTEDSVDYTGPNGDQWHNRVARDYIPDHIGDVVSIPPGDSITVNQGFTLDTSWNYEKIRFVAFIQDTFMQPDSVIEIWQGGILDIAELGIAEYENTNIIKKNITPSPNPCVNGTRFSFTLPNSQCYEIKFYDITGRKIRTLDGIATGNEQTVEWDLRNDKGLRVSSGVYLYHFKSNEVYATGKVVVK